MVSESKVVSNAYSQALKWTLILLLTVSWAFLGWATWWFTMFLAPYDTPRCSRYWWTPDLCPPLDSLEYRISAFFAHFPGNTLPAVIVVGANILLFMHVLRDNREKWPYVMIAFSLLNMIIPALTFWFIMHVNLPLELGPPPGYDWAIKFIVPTATFLSGLFALQGWTLPALLRRE